MLSHAWEQYRKWARTSREQKKRVTRASAVVLLLTLAGTAAGTMAPYLPPSLPLGTYAPWLAAAALALATFFTMQLLSNAQRQGWAKARALAEAIKSESYKYAATAAPYDGADAADVLAQKLSDLSEGGKGILVEAVTPEDAARNMPAKPLSVDAYITTRVEDQLKTYYGPAIARHRQLLNAAWYTAFVLGAAAVVASVSATGAQGSGAGGNQFTAAMLGTVTTAAAAIAAWFQSGRHEQIALNYQTAVDRVANLISRPNARARGTRLVQDIEAIFQAEHAAWLTEWQTAPSQAGAASSPPGPSGNTPPAH
jgi:hypothetical protein